MLGDLKRNIYKYLLNRGLLRTKIVVLMDGGICSQMHQYLLGNLYRKRGFSVMRTCFGVKILLCMR